MKRLALVLLCFLSGPASAAPQDAVVRITSHGCSGTVIYTEQGKSWVLSCAHAFEGNDARKRIAIDAPHPSTGATTTGGIRLIKVDYRLDASLIEVGYGPMPYVCGVAPLGTRIGTCLSVGYDAMKASAVAARATPVTTGGGITFTREKPWHGRSGGALIDSTTGKLMGIVQGYEVGPGGRGMYTSHAALYGFLWPNASPPRTTESRELSCRPYSSL